MLEYISLYSLLLLIAFMDMIIPYRLFLSLCAIILMSFFIGFRASNYDYDNYVYYFNQAPDLLHIFSAKVNITVEPGIFFLNSLIKLFTTNINVYFAVIAFLSLCLLLYSFRKLHRDYLIIFLLSVSTIFISTYYTQIRQGIAIGFCSLAYYFLIKKRYYSFWIVTVISILIHVSSLALVVIFLIRNIKFKTYYLLIIPVCFILSYIHLDIYIFTKAINYVTSGHIADKIMLFYFTGRENRVTSILSGINVLTVFLVILLAISRNMRQNIKYYDFKLLSLLLGLFFYNFFSSSGEVAARLYRVSTILTPLVIYDLYCVSGMYKRFNKIFLILLCAVFFFYYGHFAQTTFMYPIYFWNK